MGPGRACTAGTVVVPAPKMITLYRCSYGYAGTLPLSAREVLERHMDVQQTTTLPVFLMQNAKLHEEHTYDEKGRSRYQCQVEKGTDASDVHAGMMT
ncbi:hypothetical protein ACRALDRAFT_2061065 [Sodiomyces alcalophilus JCM 7366]|uniref:uncharacterized protein n=1 Tax=Sodiomyces alcalophilus JCM 7366 TaxID=591952 RepID=UPI0039B48D2C